MVNWNLTLKHLFMHMSGFRGKFVEMAEDFSQV